MRKDKVQEVIVLKKKMMLMSLLVCVYMSFLGCTSVGDVNEESGSGSNIEENVDKYITELVTTEDLMVHAKYVYKVKEYGYLKIRVYCGITNVSGDTLVLNTPRYFQLNNNGVLKDGYCEYDYAKLASGATIDTTIEFYYPEDSNLDWRKVSLIVDGNTLHLYNNPQTYGAFAGMYFSDTNYFGYSFIPETVSSYRWYYYNIITEEVDTGVCTLTKSNRFWLTDPSKLYSWSPENNSIHYEKKQYNFSTCEEEVTYAMSCSKQ